MKTDRAVFPMRLLVEAGKVEEFARAVGCAETGSPSFAPPTFTAVMDHFGPTIVDMMQALGYPPSRVLHGEESIDYPGGPLALGTELHGEARHVGTERVAARSGPIELVRFEVELRDDSGSVAARIHRTLVVIEGGEDADR